MGSNSKVHFLTMPKWGMSMEQGTIVRWSKAVGDDVRVGDEVVEVETDKVISGIEFAWEGVLRRQLAVEGDALVIGAPMAVIADAPVSEGEIDRAIEDRGRLTASIGTNATPDVDDPSSPKSGIALVENWSIKYTKIGTGSSAVILIHGLAGDISGWQHIQASLKGDWTVYSLDLPGHGESTKALTLGSLEELASAVLELMAALDIDSAHLVGHSLGGAVAITAARLDPKRVLSLTLIGSASLGPEMDSEYFSALLEGNSRQSLKSALQRLFHDPDLISRPMVDALLKYKRLEGVDKVLRKIASQIFRDDKQARSLRQAVIDYQGDVLVLWGREDRIFPPHHADGFPPRIKTAVVTGAGHMIQLEAAEDINRLLSEFLTES